MTHIRASESYGRLLTVRYPLVLRAMSDGQVAKGVKTIVFSPGPNATGYAHRLSLGAA